MLLQVRTVSGTRLQLPCEPTGELDCDDPPMGGSKIKQIIAVEILCSGIIQWVSPKDLTFNNGDPYEEYVYTDDQDTGSWAVLEACL